MKDAAAMTAQVIDTSKGKKRHLWWALLGVGAVVMLLSPHHSTDDADTIVAAPAVGTKVPEAYFKFIRNKAEARCIRNIEFLSQAVDIHWNWGYAFTNWNTIQRDDGIVRLSGDNAEVLNYGNLVQVRYACEFDPATNTVFGQLGELKRVKESYSNARFFEKKKS